MWKILFNSLSNGGINKMLQLVQRIQATYTYIHTIKNAEVNSLMDAKLVKTHMQWPFVLLWTKFICISRDKNHVHSPNFSQFTEL